MAVRRAGVVARGPQWSLVSVLLVLAGFAAWFIVHNALRYTSYDSGTYDSFWPRRFGLIPHIAGGLLAVIAGLFQIWLGLTGRTGALHRVVGRIYVAGIAVGSAAAFYLALTISPKYFAYAAGLFGLACAWVLTTSMAVIAIRRRDFEQHREWMLRSYVVTFAFVTFRFFENMLLSWKVAPADEVDSFMAFACWAAPLLLAEPLIQWRRLRRAPLAPSKS